MIRGLLLLTLLLTTVPVRAESVVAPQVFDSDEGSWMPGFLGPDGQTVVQAQHDLAEIAPHTGVVPAAWETEAGSEPAEATTSTPKIEIAGMDDLAANVPDLPQFIDRIGTVVLVLAVLLIAALFYRKSRLGGSGPLGGSDRLRVVGRVLVSRRSEVCLIQVDDRLMVVGLDAQGIKTVVPLDAGSKPSFAAVQEEVLRNQKTQTRPSRRSSDLELLKG
jgi:flagellar biogenesis protein FliO